MPTSGSHATRKSTPAWPSTGRRPDGDGDAPVRVHEAPNPAGSTIAFASMCVLMVGMSALAASESHTEAVFPGDDDVVQIGLAGVVFAALAAVVAGASPVTSEYSTRMIRTTLTATQDGFAWSQQRPWSSPG